MKKYLEKATILYEEDGFSVALGYQDEVQRVGLRWFDYPLLRNGQPAFLVLPDQIAHPILKRLLAANLPAQEIIHKWLAVHAGEFS